MSLLKWIKENVFDWSSKPPSRSTRLPEHDPGWENRRRTSRFAQEAAKRANKRLHSRLAGTVAKKSKGRKPASG